MKDSASEKCFLTYEEILNNISKKQTNVSSTTDMRRIVELINITDDIELLVKLFTVLAVYVVSNDTHKGDIITSNNIYDKLRNVLSNSQSMKTVRTLNFITALLYQNEGEAGPSKARTLVLYAQNMIRISGCLSLMCNMFTSCMLHHETWRALCQCLAESCRKCNENQTYCSHLVPMAVRKCAQGNVEAMEIIKCLLYNHEHNIQLFAESNGMLIFSRRDTLLNETSMQLLSSLVQNSTPELLSIIHDTVFHNLSHIKHVYGTQNKIGQWATIIWHHLSSRIKVTKGFDVDCNKKDVNNGNGNKTVIDNSVIDIGLLRPDDTAKLLQNVIREIHQYNAKNNAVQNIERQTIKLRETKKQNNNVTEKLLIQNKKFGIETHTNTSAKLLDPTINEMSFSFLLKKHSYSTRYKSLKNNKTLRPQRTKNPISTLNSNSSQMETKTYMTNIRLTQQDTTFLSGVSEFKYDAPSLLEFDPVHVSTPKKDKRNYKLSNSLKFSPRSGRNTINKMDKVIEKTNKNARNIKERVINPRRNLTNRSMTSRLFHAINDSCTTFVKSVKNIFKSKKKDDVKNQSASNPNSNRNSIEPSVSYSFTDYMRKRDALLSNETSEGRHNFYEVHTAENNTFCKTCNDTVSLKYKVNNDNYLKETVTKLKLGINLYGCDFKKISKAMWPRETYMTPEVLYNLYRKLIVK